MKVVILAGGFGTRISEESHLKPKPMIEIGERPILWHIMKQYSYCGFGDFVICLGYKGYVIKEYFAHHFLHESDVTFDFRNANERTVHAHGVEPWRVTLVNTVTVLPVNTPTTKSLEYLQVLLSPYTQEQVECKHLWLVSWNLYPYRLKQIASQRVHSDQCHPSKVHLLKKLAIHRIPPPYPFLGR